MSGRQSSTRRHIPSARIARVLLRSRRRCCLCYLWDFDLSQKEGQIAHVDHDNSNADEDNLAFLCLRHHNQYDGRHIQSKNITQEELRHAREDLYAKMTWQPSARVQVTIELDEDYDTFSDADQNHVVDLIKQALRTTSDVRVVGRHRGSVRLTLSMPVEGAIELLDALDSGVLDSLEPLGITIDDIADLAEPLDADDQPGIDLDDIPLLSGVLDPRTQERLLQLAAKTFELSAGDVRADAGAVTLLGVAERVRLAQTLVGSVQRLVSDLVFLCYELRRETEFTPSVLRFADHSLQRCILIFRTEARSVAVIAQQWPNFTEAVNEIDSVLAELSLTCNANFSAGANDELSTDETRERIDESISQIQKATEYIEPGLESLREAITLYSQNIRQLVHEKGNLTN